MDGEQSLSFVDIDHGKEKLKFISFGVDPIPDQLGIDKVGDEHEIANVMTQT